MLEFNRWHACLFIASLLVANACADESASSNSSKIRELIKRDEIAAIRIYNVPKRLSFITAVRQKDVEDFSMYKLEVKDMYLASPIISDLLIAIEDLGSPVEASEFDCRWQVTFIGRAGDKVQTLYCDRFLEEASMDGKTFRVGVKFGAWVKTYLGAAFHIE
jgi:hypothetical protein